MHILFLTDNFPPETNAPATRTHAHARRWVAWGHRVSVVTCAPNFPRGRVHEPYRNRWLQRETLDGIEVLRVKTLIVANRGLVLRSLDYLSFMAAGFLGGLLPRAPDVIVATSPQFFAAVGGWALAAVRRKPFVFELRDLWPASIAAVDALQEGRLLSLLERVELFLYQRSAAIVPVSEAMQDDLERRGIAADKLGVVTNGVERDFYRPQPRSQELAREYGVEERFTVGYLGTHGMAHALENVLAAAELLRERSDIHFLFLGDGAAKTNLIAEAKRRALANVSFHPPVPKETMPAAWSLCHLALVHLKDSPVFATVIPSKIFEAMGMGLPILFAGPEGEAARIVRETQSGLVTGAEHPGELAQAVVALADDQARRREYGSASLAASALYDRDALARAMLEMLESCATRHGKGGRGRRITRNRAA